MHVRSANLATELGSSQCLFSLSLGPSGKQCDQQSSENLHPHDDQGQVSPGSKSKLAILRSVCKNKRVDGALKVEVSHANIKAMVTTLLLFISLPTSTTYTEPTRIYTFFLIKTSKMVNKINMTILYLKNGNLQ